ncbi:uncharacterized protein LOC144168671 [Haemaphysalis longicornis]
MSRETSQPVICRGSMRERDPAKFSGTDDSDADDWLASFERVSAYNKWDDNAKLSNVAFSLTKVAETWYNNNESDLRPWSDLCSEFIRIFGRPDVRKLRAEQCLRARGQKAGETFPSYIEDVIDLCKYVDPSMTEADKVRNILKGVDDDAFQMLLARDPKTVADVVRLCQSFDDLRKQRALTRQACGRGESVASVAATYDEDSALFSRIKDFIREEVARQVSLLPCTAEPPSPLAPTLRNMIRDQVANALPPAEHTAPVAAPTPLSPLTYAPLTYAGATARPPPPPAPFFQSPAPQPAVSFQPAANINACNNLDNAEEGFRHRTYFRDHAGNNVHIIELSPSTRTRQMLET